jgi:ABC-type nitrate/sulfonate/bicarbonate transport system substrate-binding protein
MKRRTFLTTGIKLAGLAATAPMANFLVRPALAATPVNFQLSWIKSGQYAGYFYGMEKGYYEQAGIEATFNSGGPNVDPIANVAAGRSGIGDRPIGSLAISREKGIRSRSSAPCSNATRSR